jgi:hypothetical protein
MLGNIQPINVAILNNLLLWKERHDASTVKVKLSPCAQERTLTLQQVEASRISRQTAREGVKIRRR